MEKELYREESLNKIKSPENLNEYIKVANPGMWVALLAILALLIGGLFWCVFANIETTVSVACQVKNGEAKVYVMENYSNEVKKGMQVSINGENYTIGEHEKELVKLDDEEDDDSYLLHAMEVSEDGWYYIFDVDSETTLDDGIYSGEIIVEQINPIDFIFD